MPIYIPLESVPWFKIYGYKPSVGWDDVRKAWWLLLLGSQVRDGKAVPNTFCAYPFSWEPPYTTLRYVPLPTPVVHATFISGGGYFWVAGLAETGFCFQSVLGADDARVLSDDELIGFMNAHSDDGTSRPILFPNLHRVPRGHT